MRVRRAFMIFTIALFSSMASGHAYAQSHITIEGIQDPSPIGQIYTQVGGWTILHNHGAISSTCAAGTANSYTISGTPTLDVSDSVSPDLVRFQNATITALSDVCGHIYFWAKVLPDPSGTVDFDLSSYGVLQSKTGGGAPNSWVLISGWLQHYPDGSLPGLADGISGGWEHIGTTSGPPVSGPSHDKHGNTYTPASFALATDENPDLPGLTNPRIMKGEIWFYLKKDQQLLLNTNGGITVQTAAGGGGGGGDGSWRDFVDEVVIDLGLDLRLKRLEKHLNLPPFRPEPIPPGPLK